MKQAILLFLCIFSFATSSFGQDKKAKSYFDKAITAFKQRDYNTAKIFFNKTLERSPEWAEVYFRVGQIYAAEMNKTLAADYYSKAIKLDSSNKQFLPAYSFLGTQSLRRNDYQEAKGYFEKALFWSKDESRLAQQIEKQIKTCDFSILSITEAYELQPQQLPKKVNFKQKQYFPVLTADEEQLFFTARNGMGDEDIYISNKLGEEWDTPVSISAKINTDYNEGTCTISADGQMIVFTSCEGRQNLGSCDLYFSKKIDGEWSEPENLGPKVNSRYWDSQPSLSSDGHMLYFSSDRPQGNGRKDIYVSIWDKKEGWQIAQNLGTEINTYGDEVSPFIHANGQTLFFASNNHIGMGGFDLFLTQKGKNAYSSPVNLGYPINTTADQLAMFISSNGQSAYYSVDLKDSVNLYQFEIPEKLMEMISPTIFIKGRISDLNTGNGLESEVSLIELSSNETISTFNSSPKTGEFMAIVPSKGEYAVYVSNPEYFFKRMEVNIDKNTSIKNLEVALKKIEKDKPEILKHIFFETASYALKQESRVELDKLNQLALENPSLKIQIAGHTDDIGGEAENLLLSEQRAQSVIAYLIEKGIGKDRLQAKGYGETSPLLPNTNEENRQMNRRIELRFF